MFVFLVFYLDVLVIPNRIVPRLRDLSSEEIADAFQTASRIGSVIEQAYDAESLTIAVQVWILSCSPMTKSSLTDVLRGLAPKSFSVGWASGRTDNPSCSYSHPSSQIRRFWGEERRSRFGLFLAKITIGEDINILSPAKFHEVYPALDKAESVLADEFDQQPRVGHDPATLKMDAAAGQRIFRSAEDMEKEATWLRSLFS
jgi:HIT domain